MWLGWGLGKDSALGQGRGHLHLAPLEEGRKASAGSRGETMTEVGEGSRRALLALMRSLDSF